MPQMKKKYTETPRAMINVTENHSYVVPTRMVQEPTGWQRIRYGTGTPRAMINVTENHSYVVPTRMVQEPTGWQRIRNVQDHKKKFSAWFLTIFRQPSATDVPLYVPAKKSFLQLCQLLCNEDMNCIQ